MPAAEKACAPGEYIHHEAGSITPEKVLHAMLAADAIGQYRKTRRIERYCAMPLIKKTAPLSNT